MVGKWVPISSPTYANKWYCSLKGHLKGLKTAVLITRQVLSTSNVCMNRYVYKLWLCKVKYFEYVQYYLLK